MEPTRPTVLCDPVAARRAAHLALDGHVQRFPGGGLLGDISLECVVLVPRLPSDLDWKSERAQRCRVALG